MLQRRWELEQSSSWASPRANFLKQVIPLGGVGAEIGVHKGGFTRVLLDVTKPTTLHLIDPWYLSGKEWGWGTGSRSTIDALIGILRAFRQEILSNTVVLNIGYDLDILPKLPDQHFDWVYLDTTHRYRQTRCELNILNFKIKRNGVIAGDDWHTKPKHRHHGVCRAVREFVEQEPYVMLYSSDNDLQWAIRRVSPAIAPLLPQQEHPLLAG